MMKKKSIAVLGATLVMLVAACGSDDSSATKTTVAGTASASASSPTTATSNSLALLGTPNKATGTPVTVGYITGGSATDSGVETAVAKASAKYINDYLGGVGGHPIDIKFCNTDGTPAGGTQCGQDMLDAKVPVVLNSVTGNATSFEKLLQPANIPLIIGQSGETALLSASNAFIITNGIASSVAGPPAIARKQGLTKGAIIVIDLPAAAGVMEAIGKPIWKNAGATVDIVGIPQGTADMTPEVQAEISKSSPQLMHIVGDAAFCTSALKALREVNYTGVITIIPNCLTSSLNAAVPGGLKGVVLLATQVDQPTNPDYLFMKAIVDTYEPGTVLDGTAPEAIQAVLGFARAMTGYTGDLTSAAILDTIPKMAPQDIPDGGGVKFQCNGKQVTIAPRICSTSVLSADFDANGVPGNYQIFDTSDLVKLG
jgi:branched-chain amino acid transport system substrate-binding protein